MTTTMTMIMKPSMRLMDLSSRLLRRHHLAVRGFSSIQKPSSSSFRLPRPPSRTTAITTPAAAAAAASPSDKNKPPAFATFKPPFLQKYKSSNKKKGKNKQHVYSPKLVPPGAILAKHLEAAGEKIPTSCWVSIEGLPPVVSLDSIVAAVQNALDQEAAKGIVDLDAPWNHIEDESVPFCSFEGDTTAAAGAAAGNGQIDWVEQARVDLSLFARPSRWLLKFQNRSMVHALLTHSKETKIFAPMRCLVREYEYSNKHGNGNDNKHDDDDDKFSVLNQHYDVSDATLRVEGCSPNTKELHIINMFSRYDLRPATRGPPIEEWKPRVLQEDKKHVYVPKIFLVHFEDATWARAALRERQSYRIKEGNEWGRELTLAQYPKQKI